MHTTLITILTNSVSLERGEMRAQLVKLDQGTLGMSDPLQLTFDQLGTDRTS